MDTQEVAKLQNFLRRRFNDQTLTVRARPNKDDSAEVYIGEEFIGVLSRDDEDEDLSYDFHMAILDVDLDTIGSA
ncbi:DUF3126 family protein [Parvularcula lutaonensis]|uniref:DUF3126 family protein n=1 Tax=Parvularcula lutaonensis TaxID=491923 RepID=A0ABV7MB69_9PROT|nr:DUF3126 family protein [Parvularcula lutaonensis]GGY39049.1 hypothetical protein GCM10007148_04210 [Parvularcula lutaonensis]